MGSISSADRERQRRRVLNLDYAERTVARCGRRHFVERYHPGAVTYNLSEYPAPSSIAPTDYDHELLSTLAAGGVELIELHEEWNDALRRFGGDKFSSYDPAGLAQFIELVHSLGMKVLGYMSTGFFQRTDPDFRESWVRCSETLKEVYYDYAVCSPASPEWRAYLLPRLERMLDEYGFDGLYNDSGYDRLIEEANRRVGGSRSYETLDPSDIELPHEAAFEDLLGHVMTMTHARNGVSKLHVSWHLAPKAHSKVYDYLWVGELVTDGDGLRERTRHHDPYVVPCLDQHLPNDDATPDEPYLNAIPFMQFPLRVDGRPVTGERVLAEGVAYREPIAEDHWNVHLREINARYLANPDGPFSYGWWGGVDQPGRVICGSSTSASTSRW